MRADFLSHCIKQLRTLFVVATAQGCHHRLGEDVLAISNLCWDGISALFVLVRHLTLEIGQTQSPGLAGAVPQRRQGGRAKRA